MRTKVELCRHELADFRSSFRVPRRPAIGEMALFKCHQSEGGVGIEGHSSSCLARFRSRTRVRYGTRRMAVVRGEVTWEQARVAPFATGSAVSACS
jgi:hypothetical protein